MKSAFAIVCFAMALMVMITSPPADAQNTYGTPGKYGLTSWAINNQRVASAYNYDFDSQAALQGGATTFTFPRSACYLSFNGGKQAQGPSSADTIKIIDVTAANVETLSQSAPTVSSGSCVLAPTSASFTHYSYHARSGTCGLVPAILDLGGQSGSGTVVIDQKFYDDGCDASTIGGTVVAAVASSSIYIHDISNGKDVWYPLQPTTLTALATPATRSATAGATQVIDATTAGTFANSAYFVAVTYVDPLGGESPASASFSYTAAGSKGMFFNAPAASTGAVGWRAYAGITGTSTMYQLPITASNCTLSTKVTTIVACAMGANGTWADPTTATSLAPGYVVNTYRPNTQSHTTFAYVASATVPTGPFQAHFGPFIASAGGTTGQIEVLGTVRLPSSYLNSIGRSIKITGKITMTAGTSETPVLKIMLGPTFTTGTPTLICDFRNTTALSAAAYAMDFECRMTTNATGASGTIMAGGKANVALGAGTTAGTGMPELGTAAVTDKLDTVNSLYVVYVPTSGTNTAAQLLDLHVESLN